MDRPAHDADFDYVIEEVLRKRVFKGALSADNFANFYSLFLGRVQYLVSFQDCSDEANEWLAEVFRVQFIFRILPNFFLVFFVERMKSMNN